MKVRISVLHWFTVAFADIRDSRAANQTTFIVYRKAGPSEVSVA